MTNQKKKFTTRELIIYGVSILVFIMLASTYDKLTRTTTSDLSDTNDSNTQWVLDEIADNPLRGEGGLEVCAAVPDTAERVKIGFPFVLYESAKTIPCGASSGRTEENRQRNQLFNTAIAAALATGLGATALRATKR